MYQKLASASDFAHRNAPVGISSYSVCITKEIIKAPYILGPFLKFTANDDKMHTLLKTSYLRQ